MYVVIEIKEVENRVRTRLWNQEEETATDIEASVAKIAGEAVAAALNKIYDEAEAAGSNAELDKIFNKAADKAEAEQEQKDG